MQSCTRYRYCVNRNLMSHPSHAFYINIVKEHWNISNYRATLGHKVNHSFTNTNARYLDVIHPAHGPIVAIISNKKIQKGEEIFCSYGYREENPVPSWYAHVYEEEYKKPWPGNKVYNESIHATVLINSQFPPN